MIRMHAYYFVLLVILALHETFQQECNCQQTGSSRPEAEKNNEGKVDTPKKKCCPYNFDGKSCRFVNDRLLCGYNHNVGVDKTDEAVPYGNNCRSYKGRIECGYFKPPFTGLRRPTGGNSGNALRTNDYVSKEISDNIIPQTSRENSRRFAYRHFETNSQGNTKCAEINRNVVCL